MQLHDLQVTILDQPVDQCASDRELLADLVDVEKHSGNLPYE